MRQPPEMHPASTSWQLPRRCAAGYRWRSSRTPARTSYALQSVNIELCLFQYPRDYAFFADRHDVHAVGQAFLADALDVPRHDRYADVDGLALLGTRELFDQVVGHEDARHVLVHVLRHTGAGEQHQARLHLDGILTGDLHELRKVVHVVDRLGLEPRGPRFDLLLELDELGLDGDCLGCYDGTLVEGHRGVHLVSAQVLALLHRADHVEELYRLEVEDRLALFVVAGRDRVAGQAQDAADAPRIREQHLVLERHAVAVAARDLQVRLAAPLEDDERRRERRVPHHRALVVGDVHRVDLVLEQVHVLDDLFDVRALGGSDLARHQELAAIQYLLNRRLGVLYFQFFPYFLYAHSIHRPSRARSRVDRASGRGSSSWAAGTLSSWTACPLSRAADR